MKAFAHNKKTILLISFVFLLTFSLLLVSAIEKIDRLPNDILSGKTNKLNVTIKNLSAVPEPIKIIKEDIGNNTYYGNELILIELPKGSTINTTTAILSDKYISITSYKKSDANKKIAVR